MQSAVYTPVQIAVIDPCPQGTKNINVHGGIELGG